MLFYIFTVKIKTVLLKWLCFITYKLCFNKIDKNIKLGSICVCDKCVYINDYLVDNLSLSKIRSVKKIHKIETCKINYSF